MTLEDSTRKIREGLKTSLTAALEARFGTEKISVDEAVEAAIPTVLDWTAVTVETTLRQAAEYLESLPATDGAALKGPAWYRQGFKDAIHLLYDLADYPPALNSTRKPRGE